MDDDSADNDASEPESKRTPYEVLFDVVEKRLDVQLGLARSIDDRVATSFGVASTILPVTVGLLNLRTTNLEFAGKGLLVAAFAAYGAVIVSTYFAYHQRTLDYRPEIDSLARNAGTGFLNATSRQFRIHGTSRMSNIPEIGFISGQRWNEQNLSGSTNRC